MVLIRYLKPAVFIYECIKIIALVFVFVYLLYGTNSILWITFNASGVLFPLMALFLWIDTAHFRVYIPLYIAGKCVGLFSLLVWAITSGQNILIVEGVSFYYLIAEITFLFGDLLAIAAILIILKNMQKSTEEK